MVLTVAVASDQSWFRQVSDRLATGAWFADVGLPTLIALGGIALAAVLVKRQLMHDQVLRRADRNLAITDPLAALLVDSGRRLSRPTEALSVGVNWWTSQQWPDELDTYAKFYRAVDRLNANHQLGGIETFFKTVGLIWTISPAILAQALDEEPSATRLANVRLELMQPWGEGLIALGLALSTWEGTGNFDAGPEVSRRFTFFDDDRFIASVRSQIDDAIRRRNVMDAFLPKS